MIRVQNKHKKIRMRKFMKFIEKKKKKENIYRSITNGQD